VSAAVAYARGPVSEAFASRCRPKSHLTVSEWADAHRIIPPGTSPEPGAWRTDRVEYLREILDAFSDPTVERVVVMAASQIGKTEIFLNVMGYFAHQDPSPILFVQSTEDAARSFSKERIKPMFDGSPALCGLLSEGERNSDNTVMLRQFPGGLLACAWAGSASSLASRPIRVVLGDELDRWPETTGKDGDPWPQAVQRTSNFYNAKVGAVSTPTIEGLSAIERLHEDSDQRQYHVPCPHCGGPQVLEWRGIQYKNAAGENDPDNAWYKCGHCAGRIEERHKPAMIRWGRWIASNPGNASRGYQISALYSPWVRWSTLAREWIKANNDRDGRALQAFMNLRLGELWQEAAQKITVESLEKNRETYEARVPAGVLFATTGVDVQDNRLELEVVGWGAGRESWGIEYIIIPGDTSLQATWDKLDAVLLQSWPRDDGRPVQIVCGCIDSGGHRTQEVYQFAQSRLARNIFASKGQAGIGRPVAGKPTVTNQLRINLIPIGVDTAKEAVVSRLMHEKPGPGYCHFPMGDGYDAEFYRGLLSERRVVRGGKRVWEKTRPRNEPFDCRVLATAAMELLLPDVPGSSANFATLAAAEEKARATGPKGQSPRIVAPQRRVLSRGIE
jgi:phage terminase large subunit GpA-like protein